MVTTWFLASLLNDRIMFNRHIAENNSNINNDIIT